MTSTTHAAAEQAMALVGHHYRCREPFVVERRHIHEFARAVQAFNPAHWDERAARHLGYEAIVAPPTFAALVWHKARREILEHLITGYHIDRVVHVDQTLEIGRPLLAGDVLTCDVYFESFRHFHSFDVITVTAVLTDQHGLPVQTGSTAVLAHTGAHTRDKDHRHCAPTDLIAADDTRFAVVRRPRRPRTGVNFDRLAVNTELRATNVNLTARDLMNFARVVGDTPTTATDRLAARPPLVAPGLLVLALTAEYVTSWCKDPGAVTKYHAEFANQVHYLMVPQAGGTDIEFHGRITELDHLQRTATVSVSAKSQGRKLFGYASATVQFARPL
ncbi:MaoC family dehydratase N-terminal domain-containing protein [Nocardia sp. NPDC050406]|uniref:FAS1-like dehydratase domain-containing protein n=1 Tax=Nocardia sp. NPDC050406 TaxID=3364318 RepID=UPI00378E2379